VHDEWTGVGSVGRAGAAGVFELGLGGKIILVSRRQSPGGTLSLIYLSAQRRRIVPTDEIHRQVQLLTGEISTRIGVYGKSHVVAESSLFAAETVERVIVDRFVQLPAHIQAGDVFPLADRESGLAEPESTREIDGGLRAFIRIGHRLGRRAAHGESAWGNPDHFERCVGGYREIPDAAFLRG
jgi:hypothetical protein